MGSLRLFDGIGRRPNQGLLGFACIWTILPLAGCIIALARPQKILTDEKVEDSGIEIMIALDVSLSMAIEDFRIGGQRVNRLTLAKSVIRDFAGGRPSDRLGLVAFAGRPYVASPLTMDQAWFRRSLERVNFNLVEDGTAIGSALVSSLERLDKRTQAKSKIVLLLTDGANNSGSVAPLEAALWAQTLGIKIYTISIGTPGKHNIPLPNRQGILPGQRQEFDEPTLQAVAEKTNGRFYRGQDEEAVRKIFSEINQLEKTKLRTRQHVEVEELFRLPLSGAALLALLGMVYGQVFGRKQPS